MGSWKLFIFDQKKEEKKKQKENYLLVRLIYNFTFITILFVIFHFTFRYLGIQQIEYSIGIGYSIVILAFLIIIPFSLYLQTKLFSTKKFFILENIIFLSAFISGFLLEYFYLYHNLTL